MQLFVLDVTHVDLKIRLRRHAGSTVTYVPTSASVHRIYFVSGIILSRWGHGNKVNKMPHCNVKVSLHIWDIQYVCLRGVKGVGFYAIHEYAYL